MKLKAKEVETLKWLGIDTDGILERVLADNSSNYARVAGVLSGILSLVLSEVELRRKLREIRGDDCPICNPDPDPYPDPDADMLRDAIREG